MEHTAFNHAGRKGQPLAERSFGDVPASTQARKHASTQLETKPQSSNTSNAEAVDEKGLDDLEAGLLAGNAGLLAMHPMQHGDTTTKERDPYGFLGGGDQKHSLYIKRYCNKLNSAAPIDDSLERMVFMVEQLAAAVDVNRHIFGCYVDEWRGWGCTWEMIAAAVFIASSKPSTSRLALVRGIVEQYAKNEGLVIPEVRG